MPMLEPRISTNAWCTTVRFGAADCFNGTNSCELALNAAQQARTGHCAQRGFLGTHTVAPNSSKGPRRVATNSGKRLQLERGARNPPTTTRCNYFCRRMQIFCAPVIAQPLPQSKNVLLARTGQALGVWKPPHKCWKFFRNPACLRLLQHDFAHKNAPGRSPFSPWKIS